MKILFALKREIFEFVFKDDCKKKEKESRNK